MVGFEASNEGIDAVLEVMKQHLNDGLLLAGPQREFLSTYLRTTAAVKDAIDRGAFLDGAWVQAWDVAFAQLYLDALRAARDGVAVPRPWRLAFDAPESLPPLRHVLLGVNAHVNYDLPQALLAVMEDAEFADPAALRRRRIDHERIDEVLSSRVAAEDVELSSHSARTLLDRALRPLNRAASRRFLREARGKVWHNAIELQRSRLLGRDEYDRRLFELEVLSSAKIVDLLAPGQVLLRLSASGFGVVLPPAD